MTEPEAPMKVPHAARPAWPARPPGRAIRLLAAAILCGLTSCSATLGLPSGLHAVELVLPPFPDYWSFLPELGWKVEWRGEGWERRMAAVGAGGRLEVLLPRGREQAILAWPESRGRRLHPAGARYPADVLTQGALAFPQSRGRLVLGWAGGWTASVLDALRAAGQDPSRYNLGRLETEVASRGGDPWRLSPTRAAALLAAGDFRVDLLDRPPLHAVVLPGPGPWAGEGALMDCPRMRVDGGWDLELPEGLWTMVGADARLAVRVDEGGGAVMVPLH